MENALQTDLLHVIDAMMNAAEPRIVALVPAAFLESHLQALIIEKLPAMTAKLSDKLFGMNGAFSPIAVKIDLAEALGCITSDLANRAKYVVRIRNLLAHRIDVRDFDHPEVEKLVNKSHALNSAPVPQVFHEGEWKPLTRDNNEGRFMAATFSVCCAISAKIFGGSFELKFEHGGAFGKLRTISIMKAPNSPKA